MQVQKYQMNSNQETGFNACSYYLKVSKRLDRKQPRKGENTIFRIIRLWANFYTSSANYSILCGTIWSKFELLLDIMHVLDTYKFKMDLINTKRKKWKHQFFICLRATHSVVRGRISPKCTLIQALVYVIITCKYEKDPIKNNREKVATPFFKLNFYLLPWKPAVGSGRISNSSKLLRMSSLRASMKRIR